MPLSGAYTANQLAQRCARAEIKIDQLQAALKPFCEADWYADGFGGYSGKVSGADLDRAKAAYTQAHAPVCAVTGLETGDPRACGDCDPCTAPTETNKF